MKKLKKKKLLEIKRQERAKKVEEAREKKREKELESVLERADKVLSSLVATPTLFKPAARKSGKINVGQVSGVIKRFFLARQAEPGLFHKSSC